MAVLCGLCDLCGKRRSPPFVAVLRASVVRGRAPRRRRKCAPPERLQPPVVSTRDTGVLPSGQCATVAQGGRFLRPTLPHGAALTRAPDPASSRDHGTGHRALEAASRTDSADFHTSAGRRRCALPLLMQPLPSLVLGKARCASGASVGRTPSDRLQSRNRRATSSCYRQEPPAYYLDRRATLRPAAEGSAASTPPTGGARRAPGRARPA